MSTHQTPWPSGGSHGGLPATALTASELSRLSVAQVKALVAELSGDDCAVWALLESDTRTGVRRLAVQRRRALAREAAEAARLESMLRFEQRNWGRGLTSVAGVDEVGRGCLAGPVVAAAVVLPRECRLPGLKDSKKLTPGCRERLDAQIRSAASGIGIGLVEAEEIDRVNIKQAALHAMRKALAQLPSKPQQVLVDGNTRPGSGLPETAIVDGDARSLTIAAASVVAKVYRDRLMVRCHADNPQYGFASNKGYGSALHLDALQEHGPCPLHRLSFGPVTRAAHAQTERTVRDYRERLRRCLSVAELLQVGETIRSRMAGFDNYQVEKLRDQYRRTQARLRDVGERGESLAAQHLRAAGYRLISRRYRAAGGEVDLVARCGDELVFVEVKTSAGGQLGQPEDRVDYGKRARLARAARHFLQHRAAGKPACRFDVIAVDLSESKPRVEHLRDAFQP